jgi:hypothetical protein
MYEYVAIHENNTTLALDNPTEEGIDHAREYMRGLTISERNTFQLEWKKYQEQAKSKQDEWHKTRRELAKMHDYKVSEYKKTTRNK